MDYNEFSKKVFNNQYVHGDTLWIVDYRYLSIDTQQLRHQPPTQVALQIKGTVKYYPEQKSANVHFRPILRSGKLGAKEVYPIQHRYDEYTLHVFETREEAIAQYHQFCDEINKQIDNAQAEAIQRYNALRAKINDNRDKFSNN
jgi:hypothetical protein